MAMIRVKKVLSSMVAGRAGIIMGIKHSNIIGRFLAGRKGFGMNEILGIAAGLIIAALIVVPGLKTFTNNIMGKLSQWWLSVQNIFFSTSIQ